ncbi:hypothetical protein PGB90_009020 [Kerria lacca]
MQFKMLFIFTLGLFATYVLGVQYQPEQIHISFGNNISEIVVTWSTWDKTNQSVVEYGIGGLISRAVGKWVLFTDGGNEKRKQYIHKVTLSNLLAEETYFYHCGSDLGWSNVYYFKTLPTSSTWSPHFAVFGDLGNVNAQSLPRLQEETQKGLYDAILHVGDFAYDMDSDNARVGDAFMRQLEPIAAYVPYLTCPGNHEEKYNFSNYRTRFSMSGAPDNMFYSFNIGPAHIISFNTEYYYFIKYGLKSLILQYMWLEKDLKEANKPVNRRKHPWIITFAHRPMYCSNIYADDCKDEDDIIRTGIPMLKMFGLEKLFYDNGVDLEIWAHEHSYERLWPVYNRIVLNGSYNEPYTNPRAPVHITTGSAGCDEFISKFVNNPPNWSAFRSTDYGYTRMKIHNSSHLCLEQISDDKDGKIIDHICIVKDQHRLYNSI